MRLAEPADVPAIVACVRAAYALYVPRIGREPAPMNADYLELVRRGSVWVLRDVAGVLVAFPVDGALFVENVAVEPARQGQGLGRELLSLAEQLCREHGLPELRLYTNARMTENLALYAHLGYVEYERRTENGFERVYLRKRLASA